MDDSFVINEIINGELMALVFTHDCPPIPVRNFDWSCYIDKYGADDSPYGRGKTPYDALVDLKEQMED